MSHEGAEASGLGHMSITKRVMANICIPSERSAGGSAQNGNGRHVPPLGLRMTRHGEAEHIGAVAATNLAHRVDGEGSHMQGKSYPQFDADMDDLADVPASVRYSAAVSMSITRELRVELHPTL
jgi:hypothetical protein